MRTNLSCHFYTLNSPPIFPRPGPIDLDMHSSVFLIMPKPSGLALPIAVPIVQRPCLPFTHFLNLDRPSYILPALGGNVSQSARRAACTLSVERDGPRLVSPVGCRATMMFGTSSPIDPSIVPAFPFLGLSFCFSGALPMELGLHQQIRRLPCGMWRFPSLCRPSVIRAKV